MNVQSIVLRLFLWLPAAMLVASAGVKFAGTPQVVNGLTKVGFLPGFPLPLLAALELACAIALLTPRTWRIGFFLVCGYLGGAGAIEIAGHQPPIAFVLLAFIWIGAYLKDKSLFGFAV